MEQGTKSTFQGHPEHGLVPTAWANPMAGCTMSMALLGCQPQKHREQGQKGL